MTGWRSVLDLDYIADLGAAVDALGESDDDAPIPQVQTRVCTDIGHAFANGAALTPSDRYYEARVGIDIERACREPWRRGGAGHDRDPMKQRVYMLGWHGRKRQKKRCRIAEMMERMRAPKGTR